MSKRKSLEILKFFNLKFGKTILKMMTGARANFSVDSSSATGSRTSSCADVESCTVKPSSCADAKSCSGRTSSSAYAKKGGRKG